MGVHFWETTETHNLPSGYQEVEYIDSNGSGSSINGPYINTGYSWTTNNGEVKFKYRPLAFGNAYYIDRFGGAYKNNNRAFSLYVCYSSPYVGLGGNDIQLTGNTFSVGTDYEFDITANNGNADISINGVNRTETYSGSIGNNYNYSIFAGHEPNGFEYRCSARLYYFKMYEGGTLVRDFVPCYRKADNEIGLYDLVNNQFYANAGTGTFTKGADVNAQKELQNAYIGEYAGGWTFTYDFVNKTTTQLANDGWTNTSGLTTGANGVTANSWTAIFNPVSGLSTTMANANKVTIVMDTYNARGATDLSGVGVCDSSNVGPTQIGFYVQTNAYVVDCGSNVLTTYFTGPSGDSTITCEFDFVNKTCSLDFPNIYTGTMSLTDTQIATKSIVNSVRCPLQRYRYIKSLSITIS